MDTVIKSVSVTKEQDVFMKEMNLSPTALLKQKILEVQNTFNDFCQKELLKKQEQLKNFSVQYEKIREFVEKKGLIDEFLGIEDEKCSGEDKKP